MSHEALKASLEAEEGRCGWLYLDTRGNVTTGIGHLLPNAEAACALPFVLRSGLGAKPPIPATTAEIQREFSVIASQRPGMRAGYYLQFATLTLQDAFIDQLLDQDIAEKERELLGISSDFEGYPSAPHPAQDGTLDMAFNLGAEGLVRHFPRFCEAFARQDWETCAAECERKGVSAARNTATRNLFLQASQNS